MWPEIARQKKSRQKKGKQGEQLACEWLEQRGFRIEARNWRPPCGSGAGEVDIVAVRERDEPGTSWGRPELWLFEVKYHELVGGAFQPLLSRSQWTRLRASRLLWMAERPETSVRVALLWVNPRDHKIHFLENTCYI